MAEREPEAKFAAPTASDASAGNGPSAPPAILASHAIPTASRVRREPGAGLPGQALARLHAHHARLAGDHCRRSLLRRGRRPGFPLVAFALSTRRGDSEQTCRGLRTGHGQQDALGHEGSPQGMLATGAGDGRRAREGLRRGAGARNPPSAGAFDPARGASLALRGLRPRGQ